MAGRGVETGMLGVPATFTGGVNTELEEEEALSELSITFCAEAGRERGREDRASIKNVRIPARQTLCGVLLLRVLSEKPNKERRSTPLILPSAPKIKLNF